MTPRHHGPPAVHPDVLTALAAVADHERVRLRYTGRDGHAQRRHVEPVRLVAAARRWYLVAFDLERGDWRTFPVDRISDPQPTGARSVHRQVPTG